MPVIRSPPQRRPPQAPGDEKPAARPADDIDSDQENIAQQPLVESSMRAVVKQHSSVSAAIAAAKRQNGNARRSPAISVVADSTTRIWELEGEVSRLDREKRYLEEERRKLIEEHEESKGELRKDLTAQLESEKKRAQKDLESSNAQWRSEIEDINARHEKRERELERRISQLRDDVTAELASEFTVKLETATREASKLRHQLDLTELEVKEKVSLLTRIEFLEAELKASRETNSKLLMQQRDEMESAKRAWQIEHDSLSSTTAQDHASALENLKSKHALYVNELKRDHSREIDELKRTNSQEINAAIDKTREACETKRRHEVDHEANLLKQRIEHLQQDNATLQDELKREREERARDDQNRVVELELTQQRNDEAVARALSIVKRTEERFQQAVASEGERRGSLLGITARRPSLDAAEPRRPSLIAGEATRRRSSLNALDPQHQSRRGSFGTPLHEPVRNLVRNSSVEEIPSSTLHRSSMQRRYSSVSIVEPSKQYSLSSRNLGSRIEAESGESSDESSSPPPPPPSKYSVRSSTPIRSKMTRRTSLPSPSYLAPTQSSLSRMDMGPKDTRRRWL